MQMSSCSEVSAGPSPLVTARRRGEPGTACRPGFSAQSLTSQLCNLGQVP